MVLAVVHDYCVKKKYWSKYFFKLLAEYQSLFFFESVLVAHFAPGVHSTIGRFLVCKRSPFQRVFVSSNLATKVIVFVSLYSSAVVTTSKASCRNAQKLRY
jgi:hypothetical protein